MKIVTPGGSGHLGALLSRSWTAEGHEVVVLSRRPRSAPWRTVAWDGVNVDAWRREIDGADVVVNLAGRSVDCRYHEENRGLIMDSRVNATRAVGEAVRTAARPPRLWLQMSTATIYAHRYDVPNDELTGVIGGNEPGAPSTWNFSIDVAKTWEQTALEFASSSTRQVLMRTAMVMSPDAGGVFDVLHRLVRRGLGGTIGDGRQYVSWIHERDFRRAVGWLIRNASLEGPVNLASPNPLPNAEFMRELRQAVSVRFGLPAKKWMLELGAFVLRTETELILKSRRVVPSKLLESGFDFYLPHWQVAARDLATRTQSRRAA